MFDLDDDIEGAGRRAPKATEAPRYGRPIEVGRVLRALLRRKWIIVIGAVLGVAAGALVAKIIVPRTFAAQTVLVWEARESPDAPNVRELRTLVDSVKLPTNLALVRERLGIETTLDRLAARLDVRFDRDSNLVIVRAEADSPENAVALSETAVEVFLDHQRGVARERLEEGAAGLEADVERARERLTQAQGRYDSFRREHGVSDFSIERQQAIELTASLRAQADIARADAQAAEARRATPTTVRSSESQALSEARRRLNTARSRLSEDHPRIQTLTAEVAALEEAERASGGSSAVTAEARVANDRAAARRRQETYERLEQDARDRLTQLSSVEGEASALLASVRVAEGHVADVEAELARSQDQVRGASPGFRIVAPALMPEEPERSYRKPVAVGLPLVVVLLVLLVLVGIELKGLKVKTANELSYWGRAPVVATTTWPNKSGELAPMIYELSEAASRAGGRTVVIAASQLDRDIAADVTEHLRVSVAVHGGRVPDQDEEHSDTTFYDPETGTALVTEPPSGQVIVTEAPKGTNIVLSRNEAMVVDQEKPTGKRLAKAPTLASREEKTIARRRGSQVEQVHVSKARLVVDDDRAAAEIVTHEGSSSDAFVRRTSRAADRVLIVVRSGDLSMTRAAELRALVGREDDGVAFLLVGVPDWLAMLADRAGPVAAFWHALRND